ncbi:MAG: Lhr family helicase, partial [Gammaproteobacteria bacterium]
EGALETVARALLGRYGVVFRALLERESGLPPWRHLLWTLRRLEAGGEIRGGRFVAGHSGEQFALPEAVGALRDARKAADAGRVVVVNAVDPLNLAGIIVPGVRIPALPTNQLAFLDGELAGVRTGNDFRLTRELAPPWATKIRTALIDQRPGRSALLRRRRR